MKNVRNVIVNSTLLTTLFFQLIGCTPSQTETNGKVMEQVSENLFLEMMSDIHAEMLTDSERVSILNLLAEVKTKKIKFPWGVKSPSPSLRMKYRMKILMSGRSYYFYFRDDGVLMNIGDDRTHAYLPDEENASELARIITSVGGRMK